MTSWVCATIPMAGTVTYDCIPEVATLPSPDACILMSSARPPTTNSLSVNSLAVTLSVAQIFEFPCQSENLEMAGKLDEAWSVTV